MPRRKRDVKESGDSLRKRPRREVQDGETVVLSDSDDEDEDFLPTLSSREGRRRDRERKSPSNAGMTEEQMLDLAVRLSEQEASKAALRLRQEEEAVRKAIEESLCGDLKSSHPASESLLGGGPTQPCPPSQGQSQGWIPQEDDLEFTTMQPTRRKLSYPNHRAGREAPVGAGSPCVEEDLDGEEKRRRRRNEGSMLMEMPDLSQTQKLCTQPSPSASPPSQKYGTSQRNLLEDLSCGSTPKNCDPAPQNGDSAQPASSPVFPASKLPPAVSPVLCIPRLSQNLLADYGSSGFLLCSQPGASEGTLFSSLKSPVFPASPDHRFSKTEGSVLRKAHDPGFPVTCSPSSSGSDRTTIPRSPVLSRTDCVTLFESDGEEEAETQIVSDCPKSPVFPSSRPITDKETRSTVSHPPSSANEKRGEEDSLTCPTHRSSEVNNRAPPTQCLSQSRTSLSLRRRRALKASQPEDILDQDNMSPDDVGQEEKEKEEAQEEVSRAEGESLQELSSDMVLRWSDEEEEEEEGDLAKLPSALSPSPVFPQEGPSPQLDTQEPPPQPSHRPRPSSPSQSHVSHAPGPCLDPGPGPSPHKRPLADSNSQGVSQAKRPRRKFTYRGMYAAGAPSLSQGARQPETRGASHLQARGPSSQTSTPREEQGGGGAVRYYWGVPFCPQGQDPDTYTQVILAQLEVYEKSLKEAQRTLLRKAEWGEAILPGPPDSASSRPGRLRRPHAPRLPEEEEEEEEEEERGGGKRKETEEEEEEVEVVEDEEGGEKAGEERGRRGWGWKECDTFLLSSPEPEEKSPSPVFRESRQTPPLRRLGLRRGERGASHTPAPPVEEERRTIEEGGKERRGAKEEEELDLGGSDVCPETQLSDDDRTQDLMVTSPAQPQPQPVLPQPQREAVGVEEEEEGMEVEVDGEVGTVASRGQDVGMEDEEEEEEGQGSSRRGPDPPRMECPMCMQLFPLGEIEMHAAYCDGAPGGALEDMDTQEESQGSVKARRKRTRRGEIVGGEQPSSSACSSNSRPPHPREKCFLCQKLFPVRDYERHVEQCIHQQQQQQASRPGQSGTLLSALDQTESKDHGRAGVGSCDLSFRSSVLTERRGEGGPGDSGEERSGTSLQVSTSPIRSFTSISEATNCLIDFKHQYNTTKLSRGGRGGRKRANRR